MAAQRPQARVGVMRLPKTVEFAHNSPEWQRGEKKRSRILTPFDNVGKVEKSGGIDGDVGHIMECGARNKAQQRKINSRGLPNAFESLTLDADGLLT